MKKFVPFICSMMVHIFLFGQQVSSPDSLIRKLADTSEEKQYPLLYGIAWELFGVDDEKATYYAERAYKLALSGKDSLAIVRSGRLWGQLLRRQEKIMSSLKVLNNVMGIAERNDLREEYKLILNSLSLAYVYSPYKDLALQLGLKCLKLREQDRDPRLCMTMNNLGILYNQLQLYNKALEYYSRAIELAKSSNDSSTLSLGSLNIASTYILSGDTAEGARYYLQAIQYGDSKLRDHFKAENETAWGEYYLRIGHYDKARNKLLSVIYLSKSFRQIISAKLSLIKIAVRKGELSAADASFSEVEQMTVDAEHEYIRFELLDAYSEYFEARGEFHRAIECLRLKMKLSTARVSEPTIAEITTMGLFHARKQDIEKIQRQQDILELQNETIGLHRRYNVAVSILYILILFLVAMLIRLLIRKSKINLRLDALVKKRTMELDASYKKLRHAHDEQTIVIDNIYKKVLEFHASWKGLTELATMENSHMATYLKEAEVTVEKIKEGVAVYVSNRKGR